jgi:hypothetical protein
MAAGRNVDVIDKVQVKVEVPYTRPAPITVILLIGGNELEYSFRTG